MDRSRTPRLLGAVLLLIGGAVHLKLNFDDYGNDDIIRAFALNAAASAIVAAYLVLCDDLLGPLAGMGVSIGTLLAFGLSRRGDGILDFREVGFTNPSPYGVITVAAEALALVVLVLGALEVRRATSSPRS